MSWPVQEPNQNGAPHSGYTSEYLYDGGISSTNIFVPMKPAGVLVPYSNAAQCLSFQYHFAQWQSRPSSDCSAT